MWKKIKDFCTDKKKKEEKNVEGTKHGFHSQGAHGCGGHMTGTREGENGVLECGCRVLWGPEGGGYIWPGGW